MPSRLLPLALAAALGLSSAPARADDTPSRWIAALPFGVGQFQNGDAALGAMFAIGEIGLAGASIATFAVARHLAATSPAGNAPGQPVDIAAVNQQLGGWATANRVMFIGWAALTVAGVIEAEVNFSPRRPPVAVTAAAAPGGGLLGVRAAF